MVDSKVLFDMEWHSSNFLGTVWRLHQRIIFVQFIWDECNIGATHYKFLQLHRAVILYLGHLVLLWSEQL